MSKDPEKPRSGDAPRQLTPRQLAAALALAGGAAVAEAAQKAGRSARAVQRWLLRPDFAARVNELRSQLTSQALGVLAAGQVGAGATLRWLSLNGKSEMVRLCASRAILELSLKLSEATTLEERIRRLEELQSERQALAGHEPGANGRFTRWPQ